MNAPTIITLTRDVNALLIPSGSPIYLQQGTEVSITQELGSTFTVSIYGNLARIEGKDADALGREIKVTETQVPEGVSLEAFIWEQLKTCYDPEIPVNIVDLGLVYNCEILPTPEEKFIVEITMTLTAPGCGMGPVLTADVKQKVEAITIVKEANIELVFDPPWDRSKMSDGAKLELGIF